MTESEPGENHRVQSLLARLGELSDGDGGVRFDVLLETLQARGFGPLLLTISAFLLLPVGMVPGVPALVGATLVILGVQLLRGRRGLRVPDMLGRREIPKSALSSAVNKASPVANWIDDTLSGRLRGLARARVVLAAVGTATALGGVIMVLVGFVPGLPAMLAVPCFLFGLGLTMGNGAILLAGFATLAPVGWAIVAAL